MLERSARPPVEQRDAQMQTDPPEDDEDAIEAIVETLDELDDPENYTIVNQMLDDPDQVSYEIVDTLNDAVNYRIIDEDGFVKDENLTIEPVKILNRGVAFNEYKPMERTATPRKRQAVEKRPKILNKGLQGATIQLNDPKIHESEDGGIEIITEVQTLDPATIPKKENDPLKQAEHVQTHVFPCTACDRSFPLQQLLEIHMKNHTRDRNHPCSFCSKKFFSKYDLGKHILTHTGERPYEVSLREKNFSPKSLENRF